MREGKCSIKLLLKVVDTLLISREEVRTEVSMSHSEVTTHIHLAGEVAQCPITLTWIEEVSAQTCHNLTLISILNPVCNKRIIVVATEVLHRIELVHQS